MLGIERLSRMTCEGCKRCTAECEERFPRTQELRATLEGNGIAYEVGLRLGQKRVNTDNVTVLLPEDGDLARSVTIEEDEDGLYVTDDLPTYVAVAMARAMARGEA